MSFSTRAIVLDHRPGKNAVAEALRITELAMDAPREGEVLVEVRILSLDPYQRLILDEPTLVGVPLPLGAVVPGRGVGEVIESRDDAFKPGDLVFGEFGWRQRVVMPAASLRPVKPLDGKLTWELGVLGMPGVTASIALEKIGNLKAGENVLVSSAVGAVGSTAGQIAKAAGCRIVGIAGGSDKVRQLANLGFDSAVDRRAAVPMDAAIDEAMPEGIDVYFDNVGGKTLELALQRMKPGGRVILCGQLSQYGTAGSATACDSGLILGKRLRVEGFSVRDHFDAVATHSAFLRELAVDGKLSQLETVFHGLEAGPAGLASMLAGSSIGKCIVEIA